MGRIFGVFTSDILEATVLEGRILIPRTRMVLAEGVTRIWIFLERRCIDRVDELTNQTNTNIKTLIHVSIIPL